MRTHNWESVDEDEFGFMKEILERMPTIKESESRVCAFLGNRCDNPYLVDVPVLAGKQRIQCHQDLDVFLWLPDVPHLLSHFANIRDNRTVIKLPMQTTFGGEPVQYVFIYYDQQTMLKRTSKSDNFLFDIIIGDPVEWRGEVLVVKTLVSGPVLNMRIEDFDLLPDMLKKLANYDEYYQDM